ncbi:MAG TPA: phosphopentomutase, partial [Devosia sp.]|nr:phosphopentomutase [Devosia sp.]
MPRAILCILDSVGIGGAPDAAAYGDTGANTVGHIAEFAALGKADRAGLRAGPLNVPNMDAMGLGAACLLSTGSLPPNLSATPKGGRFGVGTEVSRGKDTPSGHWEIAGVPVPFDWGYFPHTEPTFPPELIAALIEQAGLPGVLGDTHASGTTIIAELGEESIRTGKPIVYTSIDSVFQIAAHETHFGLDRLYALCETAFALTKPLMIGRVIARPFIGETAATFKRTGNRRDFAIAPPEPTLLDRNKDAGRQVFAIGKISDIYAGHGVTHKLKATGLMPLFDKTL